MSAIVRGGLAAGAAVLTLLAGATSARADIVFGLSQSGNQIVIFDSTNPGAVLGTSTVTGVTGTLVGLDFRPADNALVGVSQSGAGGFVYQINPFTGAATQVNTIPALTGTAFGVDFNPVPNALRIVSDAEQNLRIAAGGTGTVNTDTPLTPPGNVAAAGYTNNFAGATATTLYVIDSASGQLLIQGLVNPPGPNGGVLTPVGSLGLGTNLSNQIGFDITAGNAAFASVGNLLFSINLATGAASPLGAVGGPALRDIAVAPGQVAAGLVPEPASLGVFGVAAVAAVFARRPRKK